MSWWRRIVPEDPRLVGDDPDYRFTLANERTFLAWIRTALALSAGGLAAISLLPDLAYSEILGVALLAIAFVTATGAYRHWANAERSMRLGQPLPASWLPKGIALSIAAVAVVSAVLFVVQHV